jgi:hypothetical protein
VRGVRRSRRVTGKLVGRREAEFADMPRIERQAFQKNAIA